MPRFNNRAISGQPTRPYRDNMVNQGEDCWLELTFIDRNGALQVPSTLTYRIDDLTNNQQVLANTSVSVGLASTMEINIPASVNVMTRNWAGSQVNQVKVTATFANGSTDVEIVVYELIAIATVGGA